MAVPVGIIIVWTGSEASIPTGWHVCDGTNGTPDLRSKIVPCAGGIDYTVGEVGGNEYLTYPSHTHGLTGGYYKYHQPHTHKSHMTWSTESTGLDNIGNAAKPLNLYSGESHSHPDEDLLTSATGGLYTPTHYHDIVEPLGSVAVGSGRQMPGNIAAYFIMKLAP